MFIVTDVVPNEDSDPESTHKAAIVVKKRNRIIAIGTDDTEHEFLKWITSHTALAVNTTNVQLEKVLGD